MQFEELINEYNSIKKTIQFKCSDLFLSRKNCLGFIKSFYIPTERGLQSIFSLGKNSIQNLSDSLFVQFAKLDQISKSFIEKEIEIEPLNIYFKM